MSKGVISALFLSISLFAQSSAVVGAGYLPAAPVSVAPGQILTVFVAGLGISSAVHAPTGALPTTLGRLYRHAATGIRPRGSNYGHPSGLQLSGSGNCSRATFVRNAHGGNASNPV